MKRRGNSFNEDRESFDPWSVYSDLYCGLLLVFVLLFFFAIYRYLSIAEINQQDTQELHAKMQSEQQTVLAIYQADIEAQEAELARKNAELDRQSAVVAITLADIESREELLLQKESEVNVQAQVIAIQTAQLEMQAEELNEQQSLLTNQTAEIEQQQSLLESQTVELSEKQELLDTQSQEIASKETLLIQQEEQLNTQATEITQQSQEIASKETLLIQQEEQLRTQAEELEEQRGLLEALGVDLQSKQEQLDQQTIEIENKQLLLDEQSLQLVELETIIGNQQAMLRSQANQIEEIVGIRGDLIRSLNQYLQSNGIQVLADAETGAIVFESSLLFEVNSSKLKKEGEEFIRKFFPLYMDVLLRPEYREYVAEIIVEGHTDMQGSYLYNLELSQQRALSVVAYCLDENNNFLDDETVEVLRSLIAANGKSYSNPIYGEDGEVDAAQSRRVEIQFRLKDQEMVRALDEILTENGVLEG